MFNNVEKDTDMFNIKEDIKDRFLRLPEVMKRTALSRSSIYLNITENKFPKPINIGVRSVAWLERDVDAWVQLRIEESRRREGDAK